MNQHVIEARGYVRGGFGEEMDFACLSVTSHFAGLPGWQESGIDPDEIVYLSGFFAFIALVSSPSAPLGLAEAATGARATVARRLMVRGTKAELLTERLKWFQARLNKYSALWVGVLKSKNSFGAFASLAFEHVQAGDRTRQGYVEHLNAFPDFCERTIRSFHAASQGGHGSTTSVPLDFAGIKQQVRETEGRLLEALRTLREVVGPEAEVEIRVRREEALAQVRHARCELERLSGLLDALESLDASAKREALDRR